jgi:modulator of FtsH protease HflK
MAWNQPSEDKKRPPARGNPDDSSLDDMLRRWQRRVQRLWRPGSGRGMAILVLAAIFLVVWLGCGISQIDPNDRGVVQRFGRFVAVEQPGTRWHWPWPIETMKKVNVTLSVNGSDNKALVLTADQSLIEIGWSVQYRVADPRLYLFELHDQAATLRETSETIFRELVARYDLPALLNGDEARASVTGEARTRIQQALDIYQAGIVVTSVSLTDWQLPDAVLAAQRDAVKADEDRRRMIEEAQATASDIVPKAQTAAARQISDAEVYAKQTLASAEGEAERFNQVAAVYAQAPEVTRNRIYTETMEGILSRSRKIILDTKSGGGSMIYLPLDKLAEVVKAANAGTSAAGGTGTAAASTPTPGNGNANGGASADRSDSNERARERERPDR